MALFSNTLWGEQGDQLPRALSLEPSPGAIQALTAALQPLNHKAEVPDPVPGAPSCLLLAQDRPLVRATWIAPWPPRGGS